MFNFTFIESIDSCIRFGDVQVCHRCAVVRFLAASECLKQSKYHSHVHLILAFFLGGLEDKFVN